MSASHPPDGVTYRVAERSDLAAINGIYNHYVRETAITFDIEPRSERRREEWFETFAPDGPYQLLVANTAKDVAGFAYTSSWRAKAAYDTTAESTIYLAPEAVGRGIGRALYGALFARLAGADLHAIVAGITLPNAPSIALHRSHGFVSSGVFQEVGRKFDRYHDVEWFRRPGPAAGP